MPREATSATAEPDISAKTIEAPMFAIPSPPRTQPTMAFTSSIRSSAMPARFMISPAIMNIGIARNTKLERPENICEATML